MATVRSDGKERRGRSPTTTATALSVPPAHARPSKSPSSSNPRSSSDKATPNYLKPTFFSCSSPGQCKQQGKKRCCTCTTPTAPVPHLSQSTKPLSRIRSMEKPPSGPSHRPPTRTMTFNSTKDKALLKSSSFTSVYKVADKPVVMKSSGRKNTHVITTCSRGRSQTVKKGSNSVSLSLPLSSGVVTSTRAMEEAMEAMKSEPELIVHVVSQPGQQQFPRVVSEDSTRLVEEEEEEEQVKTAEVDPSAGSPEYEPHAMVIRSDGKEEKQQKPNGEEVLKGEMAVEKLKDVEEETSRDKKRNKGAAAYKGVIEETATKLAEKKNKVLALVGAFETVISLQEPETPRTPRTPQQDSNETENFTPHDHDLTISTAENAANASADVATRDSTAGNVAIDASMGASDIAITTTTTTID